MEKDTNDDELNNSLNYKGLEDDKSFVTKVRSRVSGLLNSSISKLFGNHERQGSTVRRRENDDIHENQPPRKKAKAADDNSAFGNSYLDDHSINKYPESNTSRNASTVIFTNFAEPVAGPSGIRTQKNFHKTFTSSTLTHTEIYNGEKDSDSGESTSGYSSMAKICNREAKQYPVKAKNTSPLSTTNLPSENKPKKLFNSSTPEMPNRSLFADRSLSPQVKNTSLSSRRPSFNTSNFGSPNFVDRTITTSKIINSPFYNGPTIYGGASAYGRQLGLNESRRQQLKRSFLVRPVNKSTESNPCTSLSKTARRILNTLEQYSSLATDAEKIPLPKRSEMQGGLLSKYVGVNPYRIRESKGSSNKELLVPSVPELLKMKQKQRLQDATDKIRQIATSTNSSSNIDDYNINKDNQQKHENKIKSKICSVRPKAPTIEVLENVVLQPVPLAIPENKLPKFDLVIPPPDCVKSNNTKNEEIRTSIENKLSTPADTFQNISKVKECSKKEEFLSDYIFSKPLVIADNLKSIVAINNFKFSEPVSKKIGHFDVDDCRPDKEPKLLEIENAKMNNGVIFSGSVAQNIVESFKNEKDPIMERFKIPKGAWECSTCLIRNKAEAVKCAACETLRAKDSPKLLQKSNVLGFGLQFSKKSDEWDCTSCLVRNKTQNEKCVACGSPKPSSNIPKTNGFGNEFQMSANEWECKTCLIRNKKESSKCVACEAIRQDVPKAMSGFGDKFKPPSGTWECQSCLIRNKADVNKCIACETKRINMNVSENKFGAQFKPPSDTWECDTCLIRNKNELKTCAACQTPREKVFAPVKTDVFTKSTKKWECPTCMVRNDNNVEKCPCCETSKPGVTLISKNTVNMFNFGVNKTQFNFGLPKDMVESSQSNVSYIGVGVTSSAKNSGSDTTKTSSATPIFSFGNKPENTDTSTHSKDTKTAEIVSSTPVTLVTSESDEKYTKATPSFKFGSSVTETHTEISPSKKTSTSFMFKPPTVLDVSKAPGFSSTVDFNSGNSEPNVKQSALKSPSTTLKPGPVFKFDAAKPLLPVNNSSATSTSDHAVSVPLAIKKTETVNNSLNLTNKSEENSFKFGKGSPAATFSFGKTENPLAAEPVTKPLFSFGNPTATSGGFNFSADATVPKTNTDGLQLKAAAGFSFIPPKPETNLFGTPSAPTTSSATKNGGFNFGSAPLTNNQAAVFSFGATQNLPQQSLNPSQPSSGGFNFSSPVAPTGGFNFSTPSTTPAFDANAKPTFNFTGGSIPTFAATPTEGGGPAPVRKFKKALRRTAQR